MSFCFVANSSWYLKNFRLSTLKRFSKCERTVCFFPSGEEEVSLDRRDCFYKKFYLDAASVSPAKEFFSLITLFLRIFFERPQVVFSFNPKTNLYSLISCWLLRVKCVPNVSGVGAASELDGVVGKLYKLLSKFFYRRASYVFFQNKYDFDSFVEAGWVVSEKAEILPGSGVDLNFFLPHDKKDEKIKFLMAVRLIKPKGVEEYIQAAKSLLADGYECEFLLAGVKDKSKRAVDDDVIDSLGGEENIHFLGHVEDMPRLLNEVDCVVLPSYYPEGVPRNLIEAAAAGKLIITTDMPGCKEVVEEGENGYLVEPRSIAQLAVAMKEVLGLSADRRQAMQYKSRLLAENKFDERFVVERYVSVAHELSESELR